jgi:phenylalanyl-tRNA synthetase beta chain
MEISYQWLQCFLPELPSAEEVGARLTACGLEVEAITPLLPVPGGLEGVVTGMVVSAEKHPDADKLSICQVMVQPDIISQIVCGAPNVAAGQCVLVALPGATLYPKAGEPFKIKKSKIRGAESNGMICADDELGLGEDHSGIRVLDKAFEPGTPAAQALNLLPDYIFTIGLTPNRADAASHLGVARDLAVLYQQKLIFPDSFETAINPSEGKGPEVYIESSEACGVYSLQQIEGVQIITSPDAILNKLKSVGAQTMNVVVDLTNYFLLGYGQPMHAFDADRVKGNVTVRFAHTGESMTTLAGELIQLLPDDLVIADESGPIALAGVIGGKESSVTPETKNILLETAWFHPDAVRKTARNHQIHTEASFRFARGTDPYAVHRWRELACHLYALYAGGKICGKPSIAEGKLPMPAQISFTLKDLHRISGMTISGEEVKAILQGLEMEILSEGEGGSSFEINVPAYRVDVHRPQDVYEDILRIYGYDRVPVSGRMPSAPVFPFADREIYLRHLLADQLAAKGFYEILTNSLVPATQTGELGVKMKNPLSEEHAALRESMVNSGLEAIAYNRNRKAGDLRFFEFGKTYHLAADSFAESMKLSVWIAGNRQEDHWQGKAEGVEIYTLSSIVEWLSQGLQQPVMREETSDSELSWGFVLKAGKEQLGRYGRVNQEMTQAHGLSVPVYYLEADWKRLFKSIGKAVPEFKELPKYPAVKRDLSLLIPEGLSWQKLKTVIEQTDPALIRSVDLFDVYSSGEGEEKKTSYSLSIVLQDPGNTLQEVRIQKVMERILQKVQEQTGANLREN